MEKSSTIDWIRYHYFLDPLGSNREHFEHIMCFLTKSLLDWYVSESKERDNIIESMNLINKMKFIEKSESALRDIYAKRGGRLKKAVPESLSVSESERRYDIGNRRKFPEKPKAIDEVLKKLNEDTNPSIRFNPNFLGEMSPHDNIAAFVASYISKFLNSNVIAHCVSPSITYLERITTQWMADLIGYPDESEFVQVEDSLGKPHDNASLVPRGNIVGGGTIANLTALIVARNKRLQDITSGVAEKGILGSCGERTQGLVLFCSKNAHYSIEKLGGYIGLGSENVIKIDVDDQGKLKVDHLKEEIEKAKQGGKIMVAIVATAGTTGCGAIDPLEEIAQIAAQEKIYFHVDAAHGGGFLTSQRMREKFKGIEKADSVTIDGHKMLYTGYPCGGVFFRDKRDPMEYLKQSASYILDKGAEHYNAGKSTLEGSRGADGILQLYASIYALGRQGYEILMDHVLNLTQYLEAAIDNSPVMEKGHCAEMNVLCFRYVPKGWDPLNDAEKINALNRRLNRRIYDDGEFYVGSTTMTLKGIENCNVQRAIIVHPYTEEKTIDAFLRKLAHFGNEIAEELDGKRKATVHRVPPRRRTFMEPEMEWPKESQQKAAFPMGANIYPTPPDLDFLIAVNQR